MEDKTQQGESIDKNFFLKDGHCSYSPDRNYLLYDSYPGQDNYRHLYLYDLQKKQGYKLGHFILIL